MAACSRDEDITQHASVSGCCVDFCQIQPVQGESMARCVGLTMPCRPAVRLSASSG